LTHHATVSGKAQEPTLKKRKRRMDMDWRKLQKEVHMTMWTNMPNLQLMLAPEKYTGKILHGQKQVPAIMKMSFIE
jgi:hypothetical protein